jgi:hypothetical protein
MGNKVYVAPEAALTFKDSGGDAVLALQNLGYGAGRISARYDRGEGSHPRLYKWRAVIQFETAPVVGEYVEIFLAESDGTNADGNVGTADAALTAGQKSNLNPLGPVRAQTTDTGASFTASGYCLISERYFSVGVWNNSAGDNLKNTANASFVVLTPVPDEIQASA